jgi:hypothetical protein
MNRRVIAKILKHKHDDFVSSITDPEIRKLVDEHGMITGGSIVSLLLGERVNDYDYYFDDFTALVKIAGYFVDQFKGLNPEKEIPAILQVDVPSQRVSIKIKSAGVISEASDKDYQYFESRPEEEGMSYVEKVVSAADEENAEHIDDTKPKYRPIFMSSNAITLSGKVQLVIRFHGNPDEIHKNYDFIHCCNYWIAKTGQLTLNPAALESILAKQLTYQGSLYPVCSVIRMRKFLKMGWYINAGQILKMLFQISQLDLTNIAVLEEQLTGVDAAYFFQVIEYCKKRQEEDKEFKVTVPYLVSIIDKIFG